MAQHNKGTGIIRRILNWVMYTVTAVICAGLICSAYCSYISPLDFKYAPLGVLSFPVWLTATVFLLIIALIWWRKTAIAIVAALLICWGQISDYCPIHLPKGKMNEEERARSFTLLEYNVMQFHNQDIYSTRYSNDQIDYILSVDPDIVCLEEGRWLIPLPKTDITQEQLNDLNSRYPYIYVDGESISMLSKFRAEPINLDFPHREFQSGDIGAWRLYIKDKVVNLFIVHLRSYAMSFEDKSIFKDMTTPDNVNPQMVGYVEEAKQELLPKIITAAIERTEQIRLLEGYLNKYGGETAIVCGDFNDPVGCYGLHLLEKEQNLRQVYSEIGFGPMITYNANHMFYRIDHILYRGALKPYSIYRGKIKASDHYPLVTTFLLEN